MKRAVSLVLAGSLLLSMAACGSKGSTEGQSSSAAAEQTNVTGKGDGFGGVITAVVTLEGDSISAVEFEAPEETPAIGGAALESLAEQIIAANGVEIDGVSGATYTTEGCKAAVLNALDPESNPYETAEEPVEWPTGAEPVEIPEGSNIVMASTYGLYTKSADSAQDAVIKATLYWDQDTDSCYAIRFKEALTPWMDTGSTSGWACVQDEDTLAKLGEAVIPFSAPATEYGDAVETNYAKYIQIGNVVWTGEVGSTANSASAVVYSAEINGSVVTLFDYCATEEGGKWYLDATEEQPCYLLSSDQAAVSAQDEQVAAVYEMEYKESDGHGVGFWSSPITFPGNMQLLKEFAVETDFAYDYYAEGGLTQNEAGYWQTVDAVSGATIAEGCTYLDMLKTLHDRIQSGAFEKVF